MPELIFPEWLPDQPDYANPGATEAKNVVPGQDFYKPFRSLSAVSDALTAYPRGAFSGADKDGNTEIHVGDGTRLNKLVSNSWTNVSKVGDYSLTDGNNWEFAKFGENIYASCFDAPLQVIAFGGSNYADAMTSTRKPQGHHIAVMRDFVVLGDVTDTTDGHVSERVWWCARGDPTDWDPDIATLCDKQDLRNGGKVQRIVSLAPGYALVFKERSIYRMTFVGPPEIMRFDEIEQNRGALMGGGVQVWGKQVYFIAEDGFYRYEEGRGSVPIGRERVDSHFLNDLDLTNKHRVSSAICTKSGCVWWSYPGQNSVNGEPNKIILYNWVTDRWSQIEIVNRWIFGSLSQGYTLEDLDTVSSSLDALPASLDSPEWIGGEYAIAAFDTNDKMAFFGGDFLTATIDTMERQLHAPQRALVSQAWPLIEGASTVTIEVGSRDKLKDGITWNGAVPENDIGAHDVFVDARYHRLRVSVSGGFDKARGVQFESQPTGYA